MSLLIHILRKDWHHQRGWLVAFWATLPLAFLVTLDAPWHPELRLILQGVLAAAQGVLALGLIVRAVHADAFLGSSVFWRTRPLTAGAILSAKALFTVIGVLLPFLSVQILIWVRAGFTSHQVLLAIGGHLLGLVPAALVVFALAVATRNLSQFLAALGTVTGLWVAMTLSAHWLQVRGMNLNAVSNDPAGRGLSAMLLGAGLLALCALTAIGATVKGRSKVWGLGLIGMGFLFFPVVLITWPDSFFTPRAAATPNLRVQLIPVDESPAETPGSQVFWSRIQVEGLRSNSLAAVSRFDATFVPDQGQRLRFHAASGLWWDGADPTEPPQEAAYFDRIRAWFPPETLWFGRWTTHAQTGLPLQTEGGPVQLPDRQSGRFTGLLALQEFRVEQLGALPLEPGSRRFGQGMALTIDRIERTPDGLTVQVQERHAELGLDLAPTSAGPNRVRPLVYVLHQPETGEAFVEDPADHGFRTTDLYSSQRRRRLTLQFAYPALLARLSGRPLDRWLEKARLHVFRARPEGLAQFELRQDDFVLRWDGGGQEDATPNGWITTLEALELPSSPGPTDYHAYTRAILEFPPERWDRTKQERLRAKLAALDSEGLDALIDRLPLDDRLEYSVVRPLLKEFVSARHLPALRQALRRDPGLVWIFEERGWEAEARTVLRELLVEGRLLLEAAPLRTVAVEAPPALHDPLFHQFILLERRHDFVHPVLETLPGFPLDDAVRTAWKRARLGMAEPTDLALAAAALNLPEALDEAIEAVEQGNRSSEEGAWTRKLQRLTGYEPAMGDFKKWLSTHRGRFRYQPETGTYRADPKR